MVNNRSTAHKARSGILIGHMQDHKWSTYGNLTSTYDCKLNSQMNLTNLAHLHLAVCLVQDPAHNHAYKVRP